MNGGGGGGGGVAGYAEGMTIQTLTEVQTTLS